VNLESMSETLTPKKHGRLAFFWMILGALATLTVFPYLLAINPSLLEQVPLPLPILLIAQTAQTSFLLLLLSWLGLRLGQPIGLDSPFARALVYGLKPPSVSRRVLLVAVLTGFGGGLLIIWLAQLFQPFMPPTAQPAAFSVELWKRLLAAFYGGIVEELLLRLFLMTVLAWLIWKTAFRGQMPPSAMAFWIAIVVAAVLFGAGHLPTAAGIWPLTPAVIIRTIGLNALAGIAFGLIYWRWGLEYAMLAHFCADLAIQSFGSG